MDQAVAVAVQAGMVVTVAAGGGVSQSFLLYHFIHSLLSLTPI
jgi:hypothetical protein